MEQRTDVDQRRPGRGARWRRGVALAAALVVVGVAAGCSDDEPADDADADATSSTVSETTTTLSDEEFSAQVDEFNTAIDEAGTDLCAVFEVGNEVPPPAPGSSEQVRIAVDEYFVPLLRTLADTVSDQPDAAEPFRAAADQLAADAEEAGYPEDFFAASDGQGPESLTNDEFLAANEVFARLVQERCVPPGAEDPSATTAPEG